MTYEFIDNTLDGHEHVWHEEEYVAGACELCGDHPGLVCTVPNCYMTVDFTWEPDPREEA